MEGSKKITKGNLASWGMLMLLYLYMFALNFLMPLHRDDYEYSLIWGTFEKIKTMSDVFQSLYFHYFTHGGRMVDFFVLDSFLLWGKSWFNPFNAFCFIALIVLIYWHSQQKITLRFNPYILGLIIMFCWFGLPDFAVVNIWMTGACVYLLTAVLIFAFLLPYHFYFLDKALFRDSSIAAVGMFFCGVIAGWTIENTAATMNLIIATFIVYAHKKNYTTKWMLAGFAGSVIGYLLLVIAPGNYVRYADHTTPFIFHILNQIGGGFEILLGLLPAMVFGRFAYRIILVEYGVITKIKTEKDASNNFNKFVMASTLRMGIVLLMILSKMNNEFFSRWFGNLLYDNVIVRFAIANDHLKEQLFRTLAGLEELIIYLFIIAQLSKYIFRKWKLRKTDFNNIRRKEALKGFFSAHPTSYHITTLLVLALINNLVMLASPSFPGRAGFGSAVFFIIGIMTVFIIPKVKAFLLDGVAKKNFIAILVALSVIPMGTIVLYQHAVLYAENSQRMLQAETLVNEGASSLELEPVSLKNEVLRHVYFVDFDNHVSKYGFCRYYKIKDLKLHRKF